jgi:hypothetical protein
MCVLSGRLLLLLELIQCLHLEGCVHNKLNGFGGNCHTIIGIHHCVGACDRCWNIPLIHLLDQSRALDWELDKLDFTIHDSILTTITLLFSELVPNFALSGEAATVQRVCVAQVFLQMPAPKEGNIHPPLE